MANPKEAPPAVAVLKLRELLDRNDIPWRLVRDYPQATHLPDTMHTIWWQGPTTLEFLWGHNFEYHDPTPEDVLKRLKESS